MNERVWKRKITFVANAVITEGNFLTKRGVILSAYAQ